MHLSCTDASPVEHELGLCDEHNDIELLTHKRNVRERTLLGQGPAEEEQERRYRRHYDRCEINKHLSLPGFSATSAAPISEEWVDLWGKFIAITCSGLEINC